MIDDRKVTHSKMVLPTRNIMTFADLHQVLACFCKHKTESAIRASRIVIGNMQHATIGMQQSNDWIHLGMNRLRMYFEGDPLPSGCRKFVIVEFRTLANPIDRRKGADRLRRRDRVVVAIV